MATPRLLPMASSSSMKMMHGDFSRACLNRSRTRAAPTPTNISTKSAPFRRKKVTLRLAGHRSREQRLAGAGRADQQHPLGDFAADLHVPLRVLRRKSTTSSNSAFASSAPATSAKRTPVSPSATTWARDFAECHHVGAHRAEPFEHEAPHQEHQPRAGSPTAAPAPAAAGCRAGPRSTGRRSRRAAPRTRGRRSAPCATRGRPTARRSPNPAGGAAPPR